MRLSTAPNKSKALGDAILLPSPLSLLPVATLKRWHHSSLSETATRSQGFQTSANLRIQLCWYYLCKCQLSPNAITGMSQSKALLHGLVLPWKELGFLTWIWRMMGEIAWGLRHFWSNALTASKVFMQRMSRTLMSDIQQWLAAWTLKSNKTRFESWLPLASC